MKKTILSIVAAFVVAVPVIVSAPTASAHPWVTWHWTPWHADFKYETRYDVSHVDCRGWGSRIRSQDDRRVWMYRHFDCYVWHWDGTTEEDTLHVISRRRFVVYD